MKNGNVSHREMDKAIQQVFEIVDTNLEDLKDRALIDFLLFYFDHCNHDQFSTFQIALSD
jgi:hypothetical protein